MSNLKAYKYRLYPNKKQAEKLQWTLDRARELYNAAIQERRDAYRMVGKSITYYDQAKQLPEIKQDRREYQEIHSQVLQDVLRKITALCGAEHCRVRFSGRGFASRLIAGRLQVAFHPARASRSPS